MVRCTEEVLPLKPVTWIERNEMIFYDSKLKEVASFRRLDQKHVIMMQLLCTFYKQYGHYEVCINCHGILFAIT